MGVRELLDEQIAYYRARADEYDATAPTPDGPFREATERIREALETFGPRGRVLELAAGTGLWTELLARHADDLTATDSSPEMLALNAERVGDPRVAYRVVDAFALDPDPTHDVVLFGFFLSHVPPDAFDAFWDGVAGQLAPGGRVFFIDEADHGLWEEDWIDRDAGVVRRPLTDGTVHRAVKVLHRPEALRERLARLGWIASVELDLPFYWGTAHR